ncbi:3'-N-debenzoyl-2'-deoxytaxol N-benzoyltransferase, putative [Ricinus communis]|uniref:3'-N-debenzoyl-2'-deoxytaxol N-benzoyltransferase, putative n=1 Tax=Ricinus communis TaxID=3988 RepID=B9RMK7_RICCO|nr:3'-N-debenzoyl-2'-deoxytaxol N-benzoyltransferase, putative [Ricinus communis]|eukprot:XP_025012418.1 vinorine synthase-like [Ricinus communis]
MGVEVEFISQELIKPSSPTPDHLRHFQLSFLDQIQVPVWMPFVLFYSKEPNTSNLARCNQLKKSLSKTLTIFYPLAGRVNNNTSIHCNDEGVLFVEAQANCQLSDILRNANPSDNNKLIPLPLDDGKGLAAFLQVTFFTCGGLAISLAMSHKLGDALSKLIFLNCWAAITRGDTDPNIIGVSPSGSATLFPPKILSGFDAGAAIVKDNIVTKRFVFDSSTVSGLRAKYKHKNGCSVSRVEALAAFIWSRFMAATQADRTDNKLYMVLHAVNLRPRMEPPLSNLYFGNITRIATTMADMNAKDDECYGIVSRMNNAIRSVNADFVKSLQKSDGHLNFLKEEAGKITKGELIHFAFTSLCKFPVYEIDFGWGKPVWVGSACLVFKNLALFFDTKEGNGIEAWINLKEEDMAKFELDEELRAHITSTPNGNSNTKSRL